VKVGLPLKVMQSVIKQALELAQRPGRRGRALDMIKPKGRAP